MSNWIYYIGGFIALAISLALSGFSGTLSYAFYNNLNFAPGFGWFGPTVSITSISLGFIYTLATSANMKKISFILSIGAAVLFVSDVGTNAVVQIDKKNEIRKIEEDRSYSIAIAKERYQDAIDQLEDISSQLALLESTEVEEIKAAQRILRSRAGYKGRIDGEWGRFTMAAVNRYRPELKDAKRAAISQRDANAELSAISGEKAVTTFNSTMAGLISFGLPAFALFLSFVSGKLMSIQTAKQAKQLSEAAVMAREAITEEAAELRNELAEVRAMREARHARELMFEINRSS